MPTEIAVPFRLDGNGRVVSESNADSQVRLHVLALLNTIPQERAMVPGYGTDIINLVFDDTSSGDEVANQAAIMVRRAMAVYEPGVGLIRAEAVKRDDSDNFAAVDVAYRRLDAADATVAAANSNVAIIGSNGVVREVVRG